MVIDPADDRCLAMEEYGFDPSAKQEELKPLLYHIWEEHAFLKAGFWKEVVVCFHNRMFSMVPGALFDEENLFDYLRLISDINTNIFKPYHVKQNAFDAVNVFLANKKVAGWVGGAYPQKEIKLVHHTTAFIEGVLRNTDPSNEGPSVKVLVEQNDLTIVVHRGKSLQMCNVFPYANENDFMYFVMFVFEELELDPLTVPVTLYGEITSTSSIYSKMAVYLKDIRFGKRPAALNFGYRFDEALDHRFFDLFSLHYCG
jgi:hypothetical protein